MARNLPPLIPPEKDPWRFLPRTLDQIDLARHDSTSDGSIQQRTTENRDALANAHQAPLPLKLLFCQINKSGISRIHEVARRLFLLDLLQRFAVTILPFNAAVRTPTDHHCSR